MQTVKLKLVHAFGSTCSKNYNNALAICDEDKNEPKIVFPAGKTLARKYIDRSEMDFIEFSQNTESIECITVLPTRTHCAVVEKPFGSNLQVIKIYPMTGKEEPHLIKIFSDVDKVGTIKQIVFSASEPKFMCAQLGEPHNKLIFIDTSRNKPLAESNFTIKDVQKLTICPQNSHLICVSGGSTMRLYKTEEYAFKPLEEIRKFPKNRQITEHSWYFEKKILAATDKGEILIIEEVKQNLYEVRQEYHNVFNEPQPLNFSITCICPFSRGFILGSSTGKFCLWTKKEELMGDNQSAQKLQLTRKWSTTTERTSRVTEISINKKQDFLVISLANNDIALLYLNQIIPQISDIIKQTTEKQINFQYLYKGFHSKAITGMDICQQRPLFATCSQQDSTIRVWNYKSFGCKLLRMFYFKIKTDTEADNPLITLAFHPSGYYMAVGCVDKLRLFHVLNNELRPFKEIGVKNVHQVKFSHGGHLLAVAHQFTEEHDFDHVKVYNALTLQELVAFKDTQSIVRNLQWKFCDQILSSIYHNGTLVEWKVSDWNTARKINKKELTFEASTFNHPANSTIVYAHDPKTSTNTIEEYLENNIVRSLQVDMNITNMIELHLRKEKSYFLLALENGGIIAFSGVETQQVFSHLNHHIASVTQMVISPCGNFLITCGKDSLIFVYEIMILAENQLTKQSDFCLSTVVDDFLADVVLVNKKEIVKYTQKEKEFTKVINSLSKRLKILSEDGEKRHSKNMTELEIQKNRIIEDMKYRIDKVKEQIQHLKQKNQASLGHLDEKGINQVEGLEKNYEEKIAFEAEKYFQLEQQLIQLKVLHQKKLESLHRDEETQIKSLKSDFEQKFKQSENVFTETKKQNIEATNIFELRLQQIEEEQEEEIRELEGKRQKFKLETAAVLQEFHQKLQKLRKQYAGLQKQKNQVKTQNQELTFQRKKLQKQVAEARDKLRDLLSDFDQKLESLKVKEQKIVEFEEKITELQKKKHILSYKATEMKKAIEPKDFQIDKLKADLIKLKKEFETSLERKQKANLFLEKINKEKEYMQKCLDEEKKRTQDEMNLIDQVMMDVYFCLQRNQFKQDSFNIIKKEENSIPTNPKILTPIQQPQPDPKIYFKQLIKLYHKYVEALDPTQGGAKILEQNDKNIDEVTKQIVHLEKSLFQINNSHQKTILRKNDQIYKRTKQNTELINNLNELKKQNKEFALKIKSKNIEIQNLKSIKNQLLNECPKAPNSVMFKLMNATDENLMAESGLNYTNKKNSTNSIMQSTLNNPLMQRQKSARNLPSTITNLNKQQMNKYNPQTFLKPQQKMDSQQINYKKRECEIISEIEFINERVHKFEFYLQDMVEKVRKHAMYANCNDAKRLLDHMSEQLNS